MKFRKKPVVIEAIEYTGNKAEIMVFMRVSRLIGSDTDNGIVIKTLEGDMRAVPGDWIIKGVNGEFYPVKDDIFQKTYEKVE